jgi:hypothetical protein
MVPTGATFADACNEFMRYVTEDRQRKPSTLAGYRSIVECVSVGAGVAEALEGIHHLARVTDTHPALRTDERQSTRPISDTCLPLIPSVRLVMEASAAAWDVVDLQTPGLTIAHRFYEGTLDVKVGVRGDAGELVVHPCRRADRR